MEIFITILLATVKFGMTFPLAILEFRFNFLETILWINLGGILGIYFFAYLSDELNSWINSTFRNGKIKEKPKRIFTKRNRRIVRIKQRYGLAGIAATTPILLSIPIGVFLVVRYYPRVRTRFLALITANVVWSLIYTYFIMFWEGLLLTR